MGTPTFRPAPRGAAAAPPGNKRAGAAAAPRGGGRGSEPSPAAPSPAQLQPNPSGELRAPAGCREAPSLPSGVLVRGEPSPAEPGRAGGESRLAAASGRRARRGCRHVSDVGTTWGPRPAHATERSGVEAPAQKPPDESGRRRPGLPLRPAPPRGGPAASPRPPEPGPARPCFTTAPAQWQPRCGGLLGRAPLPRSAPSASKRPQTSRCFASVTSLFNLLFPQSLSPRCLPVLPSAAMKTPVICFGTD